jgi:UDP-glucose 4-epimerase
VKIIFLDCLKRVEQIVGCKITNYIVDCLDLESLREVFKKHSFYGIINFAALKSVGESVQKPVLYYKNNVGALLNLLIVIVCFFFF